MDQLTLHAAPVVAHGTVSWHAPGLHDPVKTWFETHGDLHSDTTPLLVLHGGPGGCHDYLLPLVDLEVPLIFYDQIGCGKSTHLQEKDGDKKFWNVELFLKELDVIMDHLNLTSKPIDVLGHSWGGMLAAEWAVTKSARKLRKMVIASGLASIEAYHEGIVQLVDEMPDDLRDALNEGERTGNFEDPKYLEAVDEFYQRHMSLKRPWPSPETQSALDCLTGDPTVYGTMLGPSELTTTGSLVNWTIVPELHKIKAPTLLINGHQDEVQDVAMQPFFDRIPKVKWITLDNAAHMAHIDQREKYMKVVKGFLSS